MSDIDEIKSRLNIVDIIGSRVQLKNAGRNFKGLCPFHNEKTPSFMVSPDRQTFHCFGCGKGGSVFDFVMLSEHVDFSEALETLAERAGVKLERRPTDTPEAKIRQKLLEVNHLASEYYHFLLTKHHVGENAMDYLKHRGISDKSIKTFTLGYSPNNWDGLLGFLKKKGYEESVLETAGLVIRGNRGYYDRFRGRVMFTLKDHRGNVVGFSGRVLDPTAKEAKYINTSETPVYTKGKVLYALDVTKDAIQKSNEAVLMEGELDVISSFQAGISNVVAIKGSAVTEDHARLLRRFAERLVFALDSDLAGDAAARRGIEIAERIGFDMRVAVMPSGKDPDEAARENSGLLKKAIKDAAPIYDYFLSSAFSRYDISSSYGKRKVSDEFIPVLMKMDNPIVQGHYARKLAVGLGLSEETIQQGMTKYRTGRGGQTREKQEQPGEKQMLSLLEKSEINLLALLLQGKTHELLPVCIAAIPINEFHFKPLRLILEKLELFMKERKTFAAKDFAEILPSELIPIFDEAFLTDVSDFVEDDVRFSRAWDKAIRKVRLEHINVRLEEIGKKQRDPDISGEERAAYDQEFMELTQKRAAIEKGK